MRTYLAILFSFCVGASLAAQNLPAPPSTSATKATWVTYGQTTHRTAQSIIAAKDAEITALKDVRLEVIEWARGQAITSSVKVTLPLASNGTLLATWVDNSAGNQGRFRVYRSADGTSFSPIHETEPNVTTFRDTSLTPGASYWYFVTEFINTTESGPSNTATAPAHQ